MEKLVRQILEKENIKYKELVKSTSGFTSMVYFADEVVIKIATEVEKKKKLKKEIDIYRNINLENIPQYLASGEFNDATYLIISKVKGKGLYSIWHKLDINEKENCVRQIADILKNFNKQDASFLDDEYKIIDWKSYVIEGLKQKIYGLEKMNIDTSKITKFIESNDIFDDNIYGLVYNDAHFDNFIYNEGKIYLIDFDRVMYAPIDSEMMIFKTMCDKPIKFASEEDEAVVFDEDFKDVYSWLKKYYSDMFNIPNIEERVKVYQFNYSCTHALNLKDKKEGAIWAKKLVEDFNV